MCPRCGTRDLNGIFEYDRHAGPYRPSNLIRNHEVTLAFSANRAGIGPKQSV